MSVSRETLRLDLYRELLERWGATINLSSNRHRVSDAIQAQIADSLSIIPFLPPGLTRLVDLGSGQGFPAIPIAIATGISIDLIDSDRRKAAFLTTALAHLQLPGHVFAVRAEMAVIARACCVTARALSPISKLLPLARPLLTPDGCCLFLKGPAATAEVARAAETASFEAEIFATGTTGSNVVKITKLG